MYLKKVEISGFKTFADKTELHFSPGMTCIVGPNGVGKSNVADAIMWGLGEQSRKALRSAASQDVIFAGSGNRAPQGLSEVSLTIDNADGRLPIDFSEVTITRRLFRSGEAEYLLNRSKCRLKDIQQLFLDTGVGNNAYSIVTQGEIDTILSIRSEDRRLMLESVAGIGQYRARRDESTRKLSAAQANITRLTDIIHELSSQRQALERPAMLAKEYNALNNELGDLELDVLICQHRRRRRRIGGLAHDRDMAARDATALETQLQSVTHEQEKIRTELRTAEAQLSEVMESAAGATREADQARAEVKLAEERLKSAADRGETWTERIEAAGGRQAEYSERAEVAKASLVEMREALSSKEGEVSEKRAAYEERRARAVAERRAVEARRAELTRMGEDAARLENEAQALESLEADLRERHDRLKSQRDVLAGRAAEIAENLAGAETQVAAEETKVGSLGEDAAEVKRDLATLKATLQEHAAKQKIIETASAEAESRCRVLADFEHIYHDTDDGVRVALKAGETGELSGICGVVGDILTVPARYEAAVDAALGTRLQWVIVNTQEDARRAIAFLREKDAGRATFLPLSSLARVPVTSAMQAGKSGDCLGGASRLVKGHGDFQKAVDYLLRDVYVVKDLDGALELHRRLVFQGRCITLDGEIVEKCGAVEGGSGTRPGVATLARKRELEAAEILAEKLKTSLAAMVRVRQKFESAGEDMSREVGELESQVGEARSLLAEARKDVDYLADHAEAAASAQVETDEELETLAGKSVANRDRRAASLARAAELRAQLEEADGTVSGTSGPEADEALEQASAELAALDVEIADLKARCRAAETEFRHADEQRESASREITAARETVEQLAKNGTELRGAIEKQAALAKDKDGEAEAQTQGTGEKRELVAQLRSKVERLDQASRALTETLETKRQVIHRTEVALGREEAEHEHIVERLKEQFGLTPEEAEARQSETINEVEITKRADQLRRKIRALGPVNPGADEEFERLKAREDTLDEQKADLEQSREDLLTIIAEIDEETKSVFLDAFNRVAVEFDDLFKRLFAGGETKLTLTQPDNVLETGVDVIVKPPGKKQQHLLLLSGGERAMTALALLLAMLRVRPTPFCVMDEIDAPLDAMNTGRFVKLLEEFSEQSQFIIITHNPRTMEAADALYGVTMSEPGVSRTLSVELSEAQAEAEKWQDSGKARGRKSEDEEEQTALDLDFRAQRREEATPAPE